MCSSDLGNDISTLPDFPAEIRAPVGTLAGVSGFQVHFSSTDIHTPGDRLNALVAMNPAALKTNIKDLEEGDRLMAAGAIGPVDVVMRAYPGMTFEQAVDKLLDIAKQKVIVAGITASAAPKPPPEPAPTGA